MKNSSKKYALITGSSRGIGRAIAIRLAKDGYTPIIHYHNNEKGALRTKQEITRIDKNLVPLVVQADLTREDQIQEMFQQISKVTNTLDLLVNNAGSDLGKMIEDYDVEEMVYLTNLLLVGKYSTTLKALPLLKNSGESSIINIASRMGRNKTIPTVGAYAPAQAGVIKFTQCCALEFAPYNIRANCVAPGLTDTDLARSVLSEQEMQAAGKANLRGRVGTAEDTANAVAFLASSQADYINGEVIEVSGGSSLS